MALLTCTVFDCVSAQTSEVVVGPEGGYVNTLMLDSSGRVYAGTYLGGIFRTTNNGDLWEQIYTDTLLIDVRSLAFNAIGHLIAGSDGMGVHRSTDDGVTWQRLNNALYTLMVYSLVTLPGGVMLAGTGSGIYRSTDNGNTFALVDSGPPTSYITKLAVLSNGHAFAGTIGEGVYKSTDGGLHWVGVNNGIPTSGTSVAALSIGPTQELYLCTGVKIYRTTDEGDTWTDMNAPSDGYYGLTVTSAGNIYASARSVYKSTDNGTSWTEQIISPNVWPGDILTSGGSTFVATLGSGVYRTDVAGAEAMAGGVWTQVTQGMPSTFITAIAQDTAAVRLYVGTKYSGVFRSDDGAASWINVSDGLGYDWINALVFNPLTGSLFAGNNAYTFKSTNQGTTWTQLGSGGATFLGLNSRGELFCGWGSSVRRSTDDGETWNYSDLWPVGDISDMAFHGDTVYVATGSSSGFNARGVYRSTDNGTTWSTYNTGLTDLNVRRVAVLDTSSSLGGIRTSGAQCTSPLRIATTDKVFQRDPSGWVESMQGIGSMETIAQLIPHSSGGKKEFGLLSQHSNLFLQDFPNCTWDLGFQLSTKFELERVEVLSRGASAEYGVGTRGSGMIMVRTGTSVDNDGGTPDTFALKQNYPNPFNPGTSIRFDLKTNGFVSLKVYDVLGREVATIVNDPLYAGSYTKSFNANGLASGIYFYRLRSGAFTEVRKMLITR